MTELDIQEAEFLKRKQVVDQLNKMISLIQDGAIMVNHVYTEDSIDNRFEYNTHIHFNIGLYFSEVQPIHGFSYETD